MKIIILEHEPFQQRKSEHYFIDDFKKNGFEIEYWGVHKVIPYLKNANYSYEDYNQYVKYFECINDLFLSLNSLDENKTILIVEIWYTPETIKLFKLLYNKKFKWIKIDYYLNPTLALDKVVSTKEMLKWSISNGSFLPKIFKLIMRKFLPTKYNNPDIFFHTGVSKNLLPNAKKYVSLDYYDVLTFKNIKQGNLLKYKYIAFLDIMLVDHPDIARSGNSEILNKKNYYSCLNKIFQFIENELKMPIVIASHPKANYTNEFGDRLVLKNKTAELATFSEMILTHGSLSISYGLLAQKRICYIDINSLFNKNVFLRNIQESLYHAAKVIDAAVIDENLNAEVLSKPLNIDTYNKFLNLYYKKNDKDSNYTVIKNSIEKIFNEN